MVCTIAHYALHTPILVMIHGLHFKRKNHYGKHFQLNLIIQ